MANIPHPEEEMNTRRICGSFSTVSEFKVAWRCQTFPVTHLVPRKRDWETGNIPTFRKWKTQGWRSMLKPMGKAETFPKRRELKGASWPDPLLPSVIAQQSRVKQKPASEQPTPLKKGERLGHEPARRTYVGYCVIWKDHCHQAGY